MNPMEFLTSEHRLINRAVSQMRSKLRESRQDELTLQDLNQLMDFLSSYADICHHGKEEKILFLECESKNLSRDLKNIMEELRLEHIGFRKMREKMSLFNLEFKQGNFSNAPRLNALIEDYYSVLKRHEEKEESIFFPQSLRLFDNKEQKEIFRRFSDFDQAVMHEKYRRLVGEIEKGQ